VKVLMVIWTMLIHINIDQTHWNLLQLTEADA